MKQQDSMLNSIWLNGYLIPIRVRKQLKNIRVVQKLFAVNIALYDIVRFHSPMNKYTFDRKMDCTKVVLWWLK